MLAVWAAMSLIDSETRLPCDRIFRTSLNLVLKKAQNEDQPAMMIAVGIDSYIIVA